MNAAMIFAGLMLGLASGGHCIAMCGAGSAWAVGSQGEQQPRQSAKTSPRDRARRLLSFHAGRIGGYALVGTCLGGAAAVFHALTEWVAYLRPFWTMANTAFFLFGATLLITARQPRLLDAVGQKFGKWFRAATLKATQPLAFHPNPQLVASTLSTFSASSSATLSQRSSKRGLAAGLAWAFIPCGPLYSAWTLALFAGDALSGALTAMAFAVASGAQLAFAQWWFAQRAQKAGSTQGGRWDKVGIRMAGAALCFSAGYSIWMMIAGGKSDGLFCL